MKKTNHEFEGFVKCKNSVCTTGCSQDMEIVCDVREREKEEE
jgi:hypothetical protein